MLCFITVVLILILSPKDLGQTFVKASDGGNIATGVFIPLLQPLHDKLKDGVTSEYPHDSENMSIDVTDKDTQRRNKTSRPIRKISSGRLPSSRDPSDPRMLTVTDDHTHFYMYSAFWDDRDELMSDPVIRITSMILTSKGSRYKRIESELLTRLRCASLCQGDFSTEISPVQSTMPVSIHPHRQNIDRRLIICQPTRCRDYVTLTFDPVPEHPTSEWILQNMLPVEHAQRPTAPVALGACVPVMYGTISPYRLVEWMEMMKLLGVKKVVAYNQSVDPAAGRVLNHYRDQGYVDVWQMDPDYLPVDVGGQIKWRGPLSLTDCLYRYMFHFNRLMLLDVDELIIPRTMKTLPDLIDKLDQMDQENNVADHRVHYMFMASFFPVNGIDVRVNPDLTEKNYTTILRHRQRLPQFNRMYRKSIMIPTRCLATRNHYCYVILPQFTSNGDFHRLTVDTELGFVHHYRTRLKYSWFMNDTLIQDDTILRYATELRKNIQPQLISLQLPC